MVLTRIIGTDIVRMLDKPYVDFRWLFLGLIGLAIFSVTYCFGMVTSETGESILNTLATVQAAIFAIVFSMVILGVQLSASTYSPRLASTFKSDPAYRWTVGIFGVSIGLSIAGRFITDLVSDASFMGVVIFVAMFTMGAFWTLYDFVGDMLEKTTPEGILQEIEDGMTTESMVEDAYAASEDSSNRGPFLTLVNVILSTISERDRDAASQGLSILSDRVCELLEDTSEEEFGEDEPLDESLEDLCVDRMPNIAEEAVDEDLTSTGIEVTEVSKNIGEEAAEQDLDRVIEHVVLGLSKLVNELGYERKEERVRAKSMDHASDVLKELLIMRFGWEQLEAVVYLDGLQRRQ